MWHVSVQVVRILTACELRWLYRVECVGGGDVKRSLSTFIVVNNNCMIVIV